jgi:riboflavin biosynthesis pyrimidine reductase
MNAPTPRPRVICHMIITVDGRIVADRWPDIGEGRREYERTASTYAADAWMCGRVTMQHFAGAARGEDELARDAAAPPTAGAARGDYLAPGAHPPYAVAVDPRGRLLWSANAIDGDHVVAILGGGVSDDYLAGLREIGVSYLLAGAGGDEVDLALALEELAATFGIRTLLLEGGGKINGSMLQAGLVDEVSLLVAPIADGTIGTASVFDVELPHGEQSPAHGGRRLELVAVERRAEGVLWVRYRVEATPRQPAAAGQRAAS